MRHHTDNQDSAGKHDSGGTISTAKHSVRGSPLAMAPGHGSSADISTITVLKDAEVNEKRTKLRVALAQGRSLDPAIANDKSLRADYAYDESRELSTKEQLDMDDEYSQLSGLVDPRGMKHCLSLGYCSWMRSLTPMTVLITTSRDPSSRLVSFAKGQYRHNREFSVVSRS